MIEHTPAISAVVEARTGRETSLWAITRKDGQTLRFTDHQFVITHDGAEYEPLSVADASALQTVEGLAERNRSFLGYLSTGEITEEDLHAGRYNDAGVLEDEWGGSAIPVRGYYLDVDEVTGDILFGDPVYSHIDVAYLDGTTGAVVWENTDMGTLFGGDDGFEITAAQETFAHLENSAR